MRFTKLDWHQVLSIKLHSSLPGSAAQQLMQPDGRVITPPSATAKVSAVLLLLYWDHFVKKPGIVLILRSKDGGMHSGQLAFPGGKKEPNDPTLLQTALREAREEIALNSENLQILGTLTPLYIPVSDFVVHPYVAYIHNKPSLLANLQEVSEIYFYTLDDLFANKSSLRVPINNKSNELIQAKAYMLNNGLYLWGASAMILSELEAVLKR